MSLESAAVEIRAVFVGGARATLADGTPSGIFKQPAGGAVAVTADGLAGDFQADRRVHGGPDKAVHHYPAQHYARLAERFPSAAAALVAGSIGENVSTHGPAEDMVCLGDVFALGSARVVLTQPRRPCWKIDRRYDAHGMAAWIRETGLTGWYYRVLEPGRVTAGDRLVLLERCADAPSVAEFHAATAVTRPPPAALERLLAAPALPESWRRRLRQRLDWLAGRR